MAETHMCPACGMPKSAWKATNGQGYTKERLPLGIKGVPRAQDVPVAEGVALAWSASRRGRPCRWPHCSLPRGGNETKAEGHSLILRAEQVPGCGVPLSGAPARTHRTGGRGDAQRHDSPGNEVLPEGAMALTEGVSHGAANS